MIYNIEGKYWIGIFNDKIKYLTDIKEAYDLMNLTRFEFIYNTAGNFYLIRSYDRLVK